MQGHSIKAKNPDSPVVVTIEGFHCNIWWEYLNFLRAHNYYYHKKLI